MPRIASAVANAVLRVPCCLRWCRSIAVAWGAARFMLAPCSSDRDPYGAAAVTVRAVIKNLKRLRTTACITLVAPMGTDQKSVPKTRLAHFVKQVRVRMQLGSFPDVVSVQVGDVDVRVVASVTLRDPLKLEMSRSAVNAIRKMVQALQRSHFLCCCFKLC